MFIVVGSDQVLHPMRWNQDILMVGPVTISGWEGDGRIQHVKVESDDDRPEGVRGLEWDSKSRHGQTDCSPGMRALCIRTSPQLARVPLTLH